MIILGLTGSIGMGKSTTADMFKALGIPVYSADETVHDLYRNEAVQAVEAAFPGTTVDGVVDRARLSQQLAKEPDGFRKLEAIVHPLVHARQQAFLEGHRRLGTKTVVLDIPLLFESGKQSTVDQVLVVTCAPDIQRQRVLARPGMTEEKLALILSRQMPDAEKRKRADHLIDTGMGLDAARRQVTQIVARLTDAATKQRDRNDA
jgi:dephospho-CoA kinase